MARKKSSSIPAPRTQQESFDLDLKPQSKAPRDLSPDHKLDNLKTLNRLLVKETMEKRSEIDLLKAQMVEINEWQPFASDLEREICGIVITSAVEDEARKMKSLQEKFSVLAKEKDEVKKELGSVVSERDLVKEEVGSKKEEILGLGVKIRGLERENGEVKERLRQAEAERDEMERRWRKKEEAFDSLKELMEDVENERDEMGRLHEDEVKSMMAEIEENVRKIRSLEDKDRELVQIKQRLEGEIRASKGEFGLLKRVEEGLRLKVIELGERDGEAQEEIRGLRAGIVVLEKEKEEKEREFESRIRELELELGELRKKMGQISREKDEAEKVRAVQEVEILELKKAVEELHLKVTELVKVCNDYDEKNAQLLDEKNAIKEELTGLEKNIMEKEKGFEAKVGELMTKLNDLNVKMAEISMEKDEVENVKAQQDAEIVELKKEMEKLGWNVSELEGRCKDYSARSTQLEDERDALKKEWGAQRDELVSLQSHLDELSRREDEHLTKINQLNALLSEEVSEKEEGKRLIESLTEKKASLEKSLFRVEEESEIMLKKLRVAEMISDKALSLLKSTAEAMNETEKAHENGVDEDEEIRPFAEELKSIEDAFKSRVAKIEEMNRELKVMQTAVDDAEKKKPGLLMWLYPATTTVLAAISFAYAARGR